ncbi:MAG: hypothetical protein ABI318_01920 [Chthoniobacteraceae bacterium]
MKPKRLIKNRALSWAVRCVVFGPFAILLMLFIWGWHTRYLDPGPQIDGKALYDWGEMLLKDRDSSEYKSAVAALSQHADIVVPAAIGWTLIKESLARGIFFDLTGVFQGKHFTIYGEQAHGYRGMGANILGVIAPNRPDAHQALERMARDRSIYDYERDIAREHLGLPRAVDGWSPASLK